MSRVLTALAISLCVVLPRLALAAPPREHIDETLVRFVSAFNEGDATTVASFYTEDAALLSPNAQPVNGRDAIQAFWQGAIDAGMKIGMLRATEVDARGDLAYEVGGFKLLVPGERGTTEVVGKYIVVWKRGDHTWRLHRDIWNTTPAAE